MRLLETAIAAAKCGSRARDIIGEHSSVPSRTNASRLNVLLKWLAAIKSAERRERGIMMLGNHGDRSAPCPWRGSQIVRLPASSVVGAKVAIGIDARNERPARVSLHAANGIINGK